MKHSFLKVTFSFLFAVLIFGCSQSEKTNKTIASNKDAYQPTEYVQIKHPD